MKETDFENKCCEHAGLYGFMSSKFVFVGWPDRVFYGPNRRSFLVEFKHPDGKVDPLQVVTFKKFNTRGWRVYIIDSLEVFKVVLRKEMTREVLP